MKTKEKTVLPNVTQQKIHQRRDIPMSKKTWTACALAICLLASSVFPAFAAAARDVRAIEIPLDEGLLSLVELTVNAAILQEMPPLPGAPMGDPVPGLGSGETPSELLTACALAWGIRNGLLPCTESVGEDYVLSLPREEAKALTAMVFTTPSAIPYLSESDAADAMRKAENRCWYIAESLNTAPAGSARYGVSVYSAERNGTDALIRCDIFESVSEDFSQSVDALPEEMVTWRCSAEISLRFNSEAPFGYTLNSFSLSPFYEDGKFSLWQPVENTDYAYSLSIPSSMGLSSADPACLQWQTADGAAKLTIDVSDEALAYEEALNRFLKAHPDWEVTDVREYEYFYAFAPGGFTLVCASNAVHWLYTITLTFPPERQAEYAFYAEILRNSFNAWGLTNG